MRKDKGIHVIDCPLCNLFEDSVKDYKLLYPKESLIKIEDDFIIYYDDSIHTPVVVITDHTSSIGKEQWGRVLYRCRKLFGSNMRLRVEKRRLADHWHAYVEKISTDISNLQDLRGK